MPYNCEFLHAQLSMKEDKYLVKEIYYVKNDGPFAVHFGAWSDTSGLERNVKFNEERRDMTGVTLVRGDSNGFVS